MQSNIEAEEAFKLLVQLLPYWGTTVKPLFFHRYYVFLHHTLNNFLQPCSDNFQFLWQGKELLPFSYHILPGQRPCKPENESWTIYHVCYAYDCQRSWT